MDEKLEKLRKMTEECDKLKIRKAEKATEIKVSLSTLKNNYDIDGEETANSFLKKTRSKQLKVKNEINEEYDKLISEYEEV